MLEKEPIYNFVGNDLIYTGIDAGIYVKGGVQFVDEEFKVPIGSRAVPAGTNPPKSSWELVIRPYKCL